MKKMLRYFIPHLKKLLIYLERRSVIKNASTNNSVNSLAPKILKENDELKKIEPYLTSLKNALDTEFINNIAITGSYGSGKSTILKTFQFHHPEYEYLNISLASFKDNKEDKDDFERKLEVSILQQMFYHVKPSKIPDSRFKRIVNLTRGKLLLQTGVFLMWLISIIIVFKFGYIEKLNPLTWSSKLLFDWGSFLLILTFLAGIGLYVKSAIRLFSNSKISKFSIKGEVELNEATDKSVFNQHLEEILYYFERTRFNVVIIEDVDRFGSTDIFTKLREINILINNSNLVERKVSFVYAIKDEMFKVSTERVKFFEFIIPVIPFINPSNANDQLTKMINGANLQQILLPEFTNDVVTFIDDIDMRLLINIFQEYQIYRTSLSPELSQYNLFAMVLYKNMYPEDFGELPKRKGKLYQFLSGRSQYANAYKAKLNEEVAAIQRTIKEIEREAELTVKELRAVYINLIIFKLEGFKSFFTNVEVDNSEALEDENFKNISTSTNIQYYKYNKPYNYNNSYEVKGPVDGKISFLSVEKEISNIPYNSREKNLQAKNNGEIDRLKKRLEDVRREIAEIDSYGIKEIFEKTPIDGYLEDFKESDLIRYLLLNGYINENYNDYISVFHAINLSYDDFTFEAKVKNGISLPYEHPLINKSTVLERLQEKYFKREAIWNFSLMDEILSVPSKEPVKLEYFFKTLSPDNERVFDFISGYINREPNSLSRFVTHLVKHKSNLWSYLNNKSNLTSERINEFLKLIFQYGEYKDINNMEEVEVLATHLTGMQGFTEFVSSFSNTQPILQFIKDNSIQIKNLDVPVELPNKVFDYIYENNAYQITPYNIISVLKYLRIEFDENQFRKENYTLIRECAPPELLAYIHQNIQVYIQSVFSELPENNNESEDSLIELMNNSNLLEGHKHILIENQSNKISELSRITDQENKEIALDYHAINISWDNVYDYYKSTGSILLDEKIATYLNFEKNYIPLSEVKISITEEVEQESIKDLCSTLIYTDNLSLNANTSLLKSLPYTYENLDYTKISEDKVRWLILNSIIKLTVENFDGIKTEFEELHITLLTKYEQQFIERFSEFKLDIVDLEILFKSSEFSLSGKLEVIQAIDDSIIITNPEIAKLICYLLPDDKSIPLRFEVFEAMFNANPSVEKKIKVLIANYEKFDNVQMQGVVENFGEDYTRLFVKQNKPVFANKSFNKNLFEILKSRDLISSFSLNKDEIKVVANY